MDDYEREQMPGVGQMLLRHKVSSPRWLRGLMVASPLAFGAVGGIGVALGDAMLPGLAVLGGGAALSALFAVLDVIFSTARIAISEGEVHVQLGMAGPRIPIAEIAKVELAPSGSNRIGMGVRNDLRGTTTYTLWGKNERAVHVTRTDGTKLVLVVREPDAIARAIEEAIARHAGTSPRTRVEVSGDAEAEPAASASREEASRRS